MNAVNPPVLLVVKSVIDDSEESSTDSSDSEDSTDELFIKDEPIGSNHYFHSIIPGYCDEGFKSHFRINKTTFMMLIQEVQPYYNSNKSRRPTIELERALLFSIWLIANPESFRSVTDRFGISRGHGHEIFMNVTKIFYTLKDQYICFPKQRGLSQEVNKFNNLRGLDSFPGVVGCVDGTHIEIPGPRRDNSYYNRKGTHSVQLQAICNSNLEFLDVYCGWPGSAHDARVWENSPIRRLLDSGNSPIPTDFHLIGDAAYPLSRYLMVSFRDNGRLTESQKPFNKRLSSSRIVIEQAFGLLVGRFRKLKLLDIKNISYAKYYIMFACILHNICIKSKDSFIVTLDVENAQDDNENIMYHRKIMENDAILKRNEIMLSFA